MTSGEEPKATAPPLAERVRPYQWHILIVATVFMACLGIMAMPKKAAIDTTQYSFQTANHPHLGTKGVEVVLFYDYQCPYCKKFENRNLQGIKNLLIDSGKMHLVFMQSPFIGPASTDAAIAALCAYEQGNDAFFKFHRLLFSWQGEENKWIKPGTLAQAASLSGLNMPTWEKCITKPSIRAQIQNDLDQHKAANGTGTPEIYVAGVKTPAGGKEIQAALEKLNTSTQKTSTQK